MCGRFVIAKPLSLFAEYFKANNHFIGQENYNVAPTSQIPVICETGNIRQIQAMRWGLIPHWFNKGAPGVGQINARSETLSEKPTFRNLLISRRCLIPATGFYEWKKGRVKQPVYFCRKDRLPMAFAGLWDEWKNPAGEIIQSCTIITTGANRLMSTIHHRMPLILDDTNADHWLSDKTGKNDIPLICELPAMDGLDAWPVGFAVNRPDINTPECIEPVGEIDF